MVELARGKLEKGGRAPVIGVFGKGFEQCRVDQDDLTGSRQPHVEIAGQRRDAANFELNAVTPRRHLKGGTRRRKAEGFLALKFCFMSGEAIKGAQLCE